MDGGGLIPQASNTGITATLMQAPAASTAAPAAVMPAPAVAGAPTMANVVRVAISDPQKQGEGMSAYISYKVASEVRLARRVGTCGLPVPPPCAHGGCGQATASATTEPCPLPRRTQFTTKLPGLTQTSFSVIRRFSDFEWVREALRTAMPYLAIPALPEKQAIGRLNTEFVDVRHRALQRWMDRVVAHPELAASEPLVKFLTMPAEAFAAMREAAHSTAAVVTGAAVAAGTGVFKFLKGAATTISAAVAEARGTATAGAGSTRSVCKWCL